MSKNQKLIEKINAELAHLTPTESMLAVYEEPHVLTVEYIIKQAVDQRYKKLFSAILRIKSLQQINLIGLSQVAEFSGLTVATCRKLLKPLFGTSIITMCKFKKDLNVKCHQNLQLQIISPISSLDESDLDIVKKSTGKVRLNDAKAKAKVYRKEIENKLSVSLDKETIKDVRTQKNSAPLQLGDSITELCSPGSTIKAKRSKKVKLSSGPQNNRSKSGYGVINGFDRKCLNILHQMTKAYVKNQYPDSTPSELQSVWIPFIITDLVERHGLAEGEHSSRVVCESLLRICETWFYINTESTVVIDGEIPKAEMHRFGVMKNYKIAGAKELREKVINPQDDDDDDDEIDVVTDSDDNMSIKERINEDHGTNIPFLAVICQWNDTYYKDLNKYDAPIQELDVKINMLPPCLFEFHEYLKMHHESRTAIFSRGYSFQLELFTLIELIYPSESDQKKKDLVKDFIGDCKQMKNKYKVTRSIERRTSTRDTIYIDLFGFVFSITVNNWDKADAQMNLSCLVTCKANASSSHVKELMVESKLNFDSSSKRLARSAIGQEIKSVLGPIKKKKYIVKFTISGNEFSLSKYDSLNTKNSIRDSVIS